MTPFLFYFTFYLNLNKKTSKMAKKPKDFKIFTDSCHSYPIQNLTHNPTRFLTLIIFLLPLLLPFSPLMFLSLLHFKTKSKFKEKIFTDFLFLNPKLIDPQSKLINSILFEIKFHLLCTSSSITSTTQTSANSTTHTSTTSTTSITRTSITGIIRAHIPSTTLKLIQ